MADQFDFPIDFENLSSIPVPDIIENEDDPAQENSLFVETNHKGKKIYLCTAPDCGKVFRFKSEMNRHIIIHNKSRPFCCTAEGCNKTFKRSDTLENHMRLHSNVLPFACDEPGCDRRFVSKSALRYHEIRHINRRVYRCDFAGCGKSFLVASQLKQHQKAFPLHSSDPITQQIEDEFEPKEYKIKPQPQPQAPVPEPEPVASPVESIQWEIKTQVYKEEKSSEDSDELQKSLETIFNFIVNENKLLKEQLKNKNKQTEDQSGLAPAKKISFLDFTESNGSYFDSDELKFLEFLREKGDNNL